MTQHEPRIDSPPVGDVVPSDIAPPGRRRTAAAGELIPPTASSAPPSVGSSACDPSALGRVPEQAAAAVAALHGAADPTPPPAEEGADSDLDPDPQRRDEDPSATQPEEPQPAEEWIAPQGLAGPPGTGPQAGYASPSSPADDAAGLWEGDVDSWGAAGPSDPGQPAGAPLHGLALLLSEQSARSGLAESDIANTSDVRGGSLDEIE